MEVKYVPGRKAVLTIYNDDIEMEKITLSDYKTKKDMHNLFLEKGFRKKTKTTSNENEDEEEASSSSSSRFEIPSERRISDESSQIHHHKQEISQLIRNVTLFSQIFSFCFILFCIFRRFGLTPKSRKT